MFCDLFLVSKTSGNIFFQFLMGKQRLIDQGHVVSVYVVLVIVEDER
jgi:hypothetical protein